MCDCVGTKMEWKIIHDKKTVLIKFTNCKKKNALSVSVLQDLTNLLKQLASNSTINSIIFTGSHDENSNATEFFSSGSDLSFFNSAIINSLQNDNNLAFNHAASVANEFILQVAQFPKIIIAAVNGSAFGLGALLLLHCDFVFMVKDARFLTPFSIIGIHAEGGASYLYPYQFGKCRASEPMILAKKLSASELKENNLVNELCLNREQVMQKALETATSISALAVQTVIDNKMFILQSAFGGKVLDACRREGKALERGGKETLELFLQYNKKRTMSKL